MNTTIQKTNKNTSQNLSDTKFNSFLIDKSNLNKTSYSIKIILLGDVAVGKTAILNRYIDGKFDENYSCTINVQSRKKQISFNEDIFLEMSIWDTCGEEKFRALTRQYYRDSNGILLVFDLSCNKTFLNLEKWIKEIKEVAPKNIITLLVGNKVDLKREVKENDVEKFCEENNLIYYEISAKDGINIDFAFEQLAKGIVKNIQDEDENKLKEIGDSIYDLNNFEDIQLKSLDNNKGKKSPCCKK